MACIFVIALALRLHGIRFGLPALLDPDELIFQLGAYRMLNGGALNPGWFGHPATTTMYVLALVNAGSFGWGWLMGSWQTTAQFADHLFRDPSIVMLPGRIAMALFGVAGCWITWRLGRRAAGAPAGLVAALLIAASPVHIDWSQIIRSDIMATFFLSATMLAALAFADGRDGRSWRWLLIGSLAAALAIASKWPFALALLSLYGAAVLRWWRGADRASQAVLHILVATAATAVLLLCLSPYLLIDHATLLANLQGEKQVRHIGATGGGLLANVGYYGGGVLWRGIGPAGLLFAILGLVAARRDLRFWLVLVVPTLAMLLLISAQTLVWERWGIALLPVVAIAAGRGVAASGQWLAARRPQRGMMTVAGAAALTGLLLPLAVANRASTRERQHDNRRLATDWLQRNVPATASVMIEHFAFDIVDRPGKILFPLGLGGCVDAHAWLAGRVNYQQIDANRGNNANLDYAAVPDAKTASCAVDYAVLPEYSRYAREQADYPIAYARYRALLATGDIVARFPAVPGQIGGRPETIVVRFPRAQIPRAQTR